MTSVVVVGAGALGLCTAHQLRAKGVEDVTVIDRAHVAAASSGLSVGIIETQYLDPLAIEVRVVSMRFFGELERAGRLQIVRNGYLRPGHSERDLEQFERSVAVQRELGVTDAVVLDRAEMERLVPDMDCAGFAGGLFGPSDGYIDGHRYCAALAELSGARVLAGTELRGAERTPDGRHRLLTGRGELTCDYVVNAAGGWAGRVGELLGAPVRVLPQRHQALIAHLPRELGYVMPSVMDYLPASGDYGLYFRDEGPGRLVAGLHTEEAIHDLVDPDDFTRGDELTYMELVAERFRRRLPSLEAARLGNVWAGLYPISPDGRPSVGPHAHDETIVAVAGAGGSGLQSSPALGRLAAEWIVDGRPSAVAGAEALLPSR
jgi:glycine/D-amino acid oxidase-like deaminating enzyme